MAPEANGLFWLSWNGSGPIFQPPLTFIRSRQNVMKPLLSTFVVNIRAKPRERGKSAFYFGTAEILISFKY